MGISGLLPLLKSIQSNTHIRHYAGKIVGIDGYVWLHRGAFACAWDLALGNHTTKYVDYAMHRIKMFRHYGVEPYVVFDGDYLPSKLHTEDSRASKRAEYLLAGMRYHAQGQSTKATEQFQKCIDITPEMAYRLILALQREGIAYVVAPYEADAQLAYLEKRGIIQAIVTEDSDLLVFGCKTVLLKMTQFGDCVEIKRERFANVTGQITLHGFTDDDFRHMAILSGCDYLPSINGVGLITSHRLLRRFNKNIKRVVQSLRLQVGTRVPPDYLDSFDRANLTFKHQRVFCPDKECLVMWNEPEGSLSDELLVYIGAYRAWFPIKKLTVRDLEVEVARGVAKGELHPMTKKPLGLHSEDVILSNQQSGVSYKPKPPTPVKSKSIKSFFSPRSKSLQDITEKVTKRDAERANTPTTPQTLFKPLSGMKRSFTVVESEERLAVKRVRKYLAGGDEDTSTVQSPFFSKGQEGNKSVDVKEPVPTMEANDRLEEGIVVDDSIEENENYVLRVDESPNESDEPQVPDLSLVDEIMAVDDSAEENEDDILPLNEPSHQEDEPQVQESPPRIKQTSLTDGEIIPDSPANAIRTRPLTEIQSFIYKPPEIPDPPTLPLSPPPSRPTIPTPSTRPAILRPGMSKKPYTPRPSSSAKRDIFPDTPTPSPQQVSLIQSWKERFSHSFGATSRPMTPVETPKRRIALVTPGVARRPASHGGESSRDVKLASVDEIEGSPPSRRPSTSLDRFRFIRM